MRIDTAAAALLLALAVTPLRAAEPQAVTLYPERPVLRRAARADAPPPALAPRSQEAAAPAAAERAKNARELPDAADVNFDNSLHRADFVSGPDAGVWSGAAGSKAKSAKLILVQQGPPGSGGGSPGFGGPPGSHDPRQDPRDGQGGGPPGSGGQKPPRQDPPNRNNPPSAPPSRPAPIWRSSVPAPLPSWWNTDFNGYDWWTGLPSGYDRSRTDTSDPDTYYYYSGWHRWRDTFVTAWQRTEDSSVIRRTETNQNQVHTRTLTSEVYRESKDCYYQAVYRYDWVQGGFGGSHWEERFDHYKARCIRNPREHGRPSSYTSHVSFDMGMAQGQDLPWETDAVTIRYDGRGRPQYDVSGAAYKYSVRLDDQRMNVESVTLVAGAKILRAPEADKVGAFIRLNAGKVEFVINDDRARYYQGETLRVTAKVVRRVVIKVKGRFWGWNEKNVDTVIQSAPVDVVVDANSPQHVTDLTAAASAPKPAEAVRSSVFIESWEFSRVDSRLSTSAVIRKGRGNSVDY